MARSALCDELLVKVDILVSGGVNEIECEQRLAGIQRIFAQLFANSYK